MAKALSPKEIKQRFVKLRNYEQVLYPAARNRIAKLEAEVAQLKLERDAWQLEKLEMQTTIQKLLLQVDALNAKVFGKRSKDKPGGSSRHSSKKKDKTQRSSASYRRPVPDESAITHHQHHSINHSATNLPHYGHVLSEHKTVDFYEEDIVLPDQVALKTVTKHSVEMAYCCNCNEWLYGRDIPPQTVTLGENTALLVSFLYTVGRYSYQQIAEHVALFYHLKLSDAAIGGMLTAQATKLRPAYERLIATILSQKGVHFDESSWKMLIEKLGQYVWVMTGTESRDAAFFFGQSRGKGVLEKTLLSPLKSTGKKIIGISDDYGAYRNVQQFIAHALCWAHPNRKLRDLAESTHLSQHYRTYCLKVYKQFNTLYADVIDLWGRTTLTEADRLQHTVILKERFHRIARASSKDPPQLATYKESLRANHEAYFVCLQYPGVIPPDNNKAERALRHVVIKRKTSLGSKTQKGADIFSVLYSVLLSLHWRNPDNYFKEYRQLLELSV